MIKLLKKWFRKEKKQTESNLKLANLIWKNSNGKYIEMPGTYEERVKEHDAAFREAMQESDERGMG